MNLGQARQEVMDRGFDYLTASRINFMLNRALTDFEDYYPWPWLRKTATGPAPLVVSDLKYVRAVKDQDGNEMFGVEDDDDLDMDETGSPRSWWIDDTSGTATLKAWPVGTATLTVRYVATDATLSSDGDTPSMPARYHQIWIDLAVIQAYKDSDNFPAAQSLRADTELALQRLVEQYATRNRQNSQTILIRAGSEDD